MLNWISYSAFTLYKKKQQLQIIFPIKIKRRHQHPGKANQTKAELFQKFLVFIKEIWTRTMHPNHQNSKVFFSFSCHICHSHTQLYITLMIITHTTIHHIDDYQTLLFTGHAWIHYTHTKLQITCASTYTSQYLTHIFTVSVGYSSTHFFPQRHHSAVPYHTGSVHMPLQTIYPSSHPTLGNSHVHSSWSCI